MASARSARILSEYVDYYNGTRIHLSLVEDVPEPRTVQPPSQGRVVEVPRVGGLHHEYLRRAASRSSLTWGCPASRCRRTLPTRPFPKKKPLVLGTRHSPAGRARRIALYPGAHDNSRRMTEIFASGGSRSATLSRS